MARLCTARTRDPLTGVTCEARLCTACTRDPFSYASVLGGDVVGGPARGVRSAWRFRTLRSVKDSVSFTDPRSGRYDRGSQALRGHGCVVSLHVRGTL